MTRTLFSTGVACVLCLFACWPGSARGIGKKVQQSKRPPQAVQDQQTNPKSEDGEQSKAEEGRGQESNAEESNAEQSKAEEGKAQESNAEESNAQESNVKKTRPNKEKEVDLPGEKDPFKRPPGPAGSMERKWALDVGFGLTVPLQAGKDQPGFGVFVRMGAGYRLLLSGNFSLWMGLGFSFHSITDDDSVVVNPSDPPESQVKCQEDKGTTLWTLKAKMWGDWAWWRLRFRLGAFGGGTHGDYRQLNRNYDTSGSDLPECTSTGTDSWMGAAGGWARLGWAFSKKAEAGLLLGVMFIFGGEKFDFLDADDETQSVRVFSHLFDAGVYFTHRF